LLPECYSVLKWSTNRIPKKIKNDQRPYPLNNEIPQELFIDNDSVTDSVGSDDFTNSGTSNTASGKINNARDFDGSSDYLLLEDFQIASDTVSFQTWFYVDSVSPDERIIDLFDSTSDSFAIAFKSSTELYIKLRTGGVNRMHNTATPVTISTGSWYHLVVTTDATNFYVYLNGVLADTIAHSGYTFADLPSTSDLYVGQYPPSIGTYGFDGKLDEMSFWSRTLTSTEVTELYNSRNGLQYPFVTNFAPTTPTDITINPITIYADDEIIATASGSTDPENDTFVYHYQFYDVNTSTTLQAYSTDNTFQLTNTQAHKTIRIQTKAVDNNSLSSDIYSEDFIVTNTLPTIPTILNITGLVYSGKIITATGSGSTDTIDGDSLTYYYKFYNNDDSLIVQNWSTTNTYLITDSDVFDDIIIYTKTYDGYGYSPEKSTTETVLGTYVTITLKDGYNDSVLDNFNITFSNTTEITTTDGSLNFYTTQISNTFILSSNQYNSLTKTDSFNTSMNYIIYPYTKIYAKNGGVYLNNFNITSIYGESETTTGVISLPIQDETIEIYIHNANNDTNYYTYDTVNLTGNPYLQNYTFILYDFNSVNVTIYNEETGNLVITNVTINVISESGQTSYLRDNSSLYLKNLTGGEYTFTFISDEYTSRSYIISVAEGSSQSLNAYLLNSTNKVVFTSKDQSSGVLLEDVIFSMSTLVNNTWKTVSVKESDIVGQVEFTYTENKLYSFTTSLNNYNSKIFELNPILNPSYTIWLNPTNEYNFTDPYNGIAINYYINPTLALNNITLINNRFEDNKTNNFTYTISAPSGDLISYGYSLDYHGDITTITGTNAYGDSLYSIFNITGANVLDTITLKYYYTSSLSGYHSFNERFSIQGAVNKGLIINLGSQTYGLGILERVLIVMLIAGIFGGLIVLFNGEIAGGVSVTFIMGYFIGTGFLEVWFVALPIMLILSWIFWRSG
jgi:hypothetical protein